MVSGDSWASAIARTTMANDDGSPKTKPDIALFFVSYIIIGNIVLLNVVVAVLLDEFIASGIYLYSCPVVSFLLSSFPRALSPSLYFSLSLAHVEVQRRRLSKPLIKDADSQSPDQGLAIIKSSLTLLCGRISMWDVV